MIDIQELPNVETYRLIDFCMSEYTTDIYKQYATNNLWPMRQSQFLSRTKLLKLVIENKLPVVLHVNRDRNGVRTCVNQNNLLSLLLRNTQEMYVVPGELVGDSIGELLTHVHHIHREGSESLYQLLTSQSTLLRIYNMHLDSQHHTAIEVLRNRIREIPIHVIVTQHPSDIVCRAELATAYLTLKED